MDCDGEIVHMYRLQFCINSITYTLNLPFFYNNGNINPVMLWLFAAPVVQQNQFNVGMTLGNHATAMQPRVKSPLLLIKSSKMND